MEIRRFRLGRLAQVVQRSFACKRLWDRCSGRLLLWYTRISHRPSEDKTLVFPASHHFATLARTVERETSKFAVAGLSPASGAWGRAYWGRRGEATIMGRFMCFIGKISLIGARRRNCGFLSSRDHSRILRGRSLIRAGFEECARLLFVGNMFPANTRQLVPPVTLCVCDPVVGCLDAFEAKWVRGQTHHRGLTLSTINRKAWIWVCSLFQAESLTFSMYQTRGPNKRSDRAKPELRRPTRKSLTNSKRPTSGVRLMSLKGTSSGMPRSTPQNQRRTHSQPQKGYILHDGRPPFAVPTPQVEIPPPGLEPGSCG